MLNLITKIIVLFLCAGIVNINNELFVSAAVKEVYTTNFACHEHRCVNPVFPAFSILGVPVMETQD